MRFFILARYAAAIRAGVFGVIYILAKNLSKFIHKRTSRKTAGRDNRYAADNARFRMRQRVRAGDKRRTISYIFKAAGLKSGALFPTDRSFIKILYN